MKFIKLPSGGGGRAVIDRTLRRLIEWNQSGRLEQISIVWTLIDRGQPESFLIYFAPAYWRQTVGRLLLHAASHVLQGRLPVIEMAAHADEEPDYPECEKKQRVVH